MIRNLIANQPENRRMLIKRKHEKALLDKLGKFLHIHTPDAQFSRCCEIMKILAMHVESRSYLFKSGILETLQQLTTLKIKAARVTDVLLILINYSNTRDGQLVLLSCGIVDTIIHMESHQEMNLLLFQLMRHLAVSRESKTYFLSNGMIDNYSR